MECLFQLVSVWLPLLHADDDGGGFVTIHGDLFDGPRIEWHAVYNKTL